MRRTRPRDEAGFTLIELIIVMIILAILFGIAISFFTGARQTMNKRDTVAAARMYERTVLSFQLDNANRLPTAEDFKASSNRGPLNKLTNPIKPYMQTVPQPVAKGHISLNSPTGKYGSIQYVRRVSASGKSYYYFDVCHSPSGSTCADPKRHRCYLTNGNPAWITDVFPTEKPCH